jgi:hypothetical protein
MVFSRVSSKHLDIFGPKGHRILRFCEINAQTLFYLMNDSLGFEGANNPLHPSGYAMSELGLTIWLMPNSKAGE